MIIFIAVIIAVWIWVGYEWYVAPTIDKDENIINKK
jgi:hypothetical protein